MHNASVSQSVSQQNVHCAHCGARIGPEIVSCASPGSEFRLFNSDFRDLGDRIDAGSVDAVITDPPYGSGGFSPAETMRSSKDKYVTSDARYAHDLPDIAGDALYPLAWQSLMHAFVADAVRVLKSGGVFLAFIDWRNLPVLHYVVMRSGLRLRGVVVWDKLNGRPIRNGFRMQSEFIIWATNGARMEIHPAVFLPGVLRHQTMLNSKVHVTQKPVSLMDDLIQVCPPGGTVYDPFCGSGTTGVAALKSGRKFIGSESVRHYFDVAVDRLNAAVCN